jgi:hypothetical protein
MDIRNRKSATDRDALLQKAEALDEIAMAVARYLASDNGLIRRDDLIAEITTMIEMKTNYIFLDRRGEVHHPMFRMMAHQRVV